MSYICGTLTVDQSCLHILTGAYTHFNELSEYNKVANRKIISKGIMETFYLFLLPSQFTTVTTVIEFCDENRFLYYQPNRTQLQMINYTSC